MIIHDNKIYEQVTTDLFTVFNEVDTPETEDITPKFHGKPIPMNMWHDIMHCMKQTQDEFKSEALVFLFYDTTKDNPWSWWLPPQETNGMTVKSLPNDPEYKKQRKMYPDLMLGTVHHHCTSSAFQSGTDEADEVNREGLHFTIGYLNKPKFDVHFRISLGGQCVEMDADTYIEAAPSPFKKNAKVSDAIYNAVINRMTQDTMMDYNPELHNDYSHLFENIHKPTSSMTYVNKNNYGLGYSTGDDWFAKNTSKKNNEKLSEEIADDFITQFFTDYEYEDSINNYYDYIGDNASMQKLARAETTEEDLRKDLLKAFEDQEYQDSRHGKNFLKQSEMFLQEQRRFGLDINIEELQYGLSQLKFEEGSTIQSMDTEAVL